MSCASHADSVTTTVTTGSTPIGVAANPVTNKIYVDNYSSNHGTVIDGATNSTTTVTILGASLPYAIAVIPITNKIYVANSSSSNVTVIDGATNATSTISVGILAGPTKITYPKNTSHHQTK